MSQIQERGSTHVYKVNKISKEEVDSMVSRCVYENPVAKGEEGKAMHMLKEMYRFYLTYPEKMSREYVELVDTRGVTCAQAVVDYLSGMTDQYAIKKFREIFIPRAWEG